MHGRQGLKRVEQLLSRARQARDAQRLVRRSGVRVIDAATPEEFDVKCDEIMAKTPGAYIFVPRQSAEKEWLARHGLGGGKETKKD